MPFCACQEIRSRRLHRVAQYLESKRRSDGRIYRVDIDPVIDIPRYVAMLILIEQTIDQRQRVRLIGTQAAETLGRDWTGRWIEELAPDARTDAPTNALQQVFASDVMLFGRACLPWSITTGAPFEWLAQRFGPPCDRGRTAGAISTAILAFEHQGADDFA